MLRALLPALVLSALHAASIDLALSVNAAGFLQHPLVGGPSYDALSFFPGNPVYSGSGITPWVVNGVLYPLDPPANTQLCILASEYPRGYGGSSGIANIRALYSNDSGAAWTIGPIVVAPNASMFDKNGSTPNGSAAVMEPDGHTFIVYGWGGRGRGLENDGGLALAEGPQPRGPFARALTPIVQQSTMPPMPLPRYRMVYGPTLLKRGPGDYLILAAITTTNGGGGPDSTWGMCSLTSADPHGPWSPPALVLVPQSSRWHPSPVEFYPAFAHGGFAYAPATSLASTNRNYQVIWRAPLAGAHTPEAWTVLHDGSVFHWEAAPGQASIWGQTISAFVDSSGGSSVLRVMYPSLNPASVGALNLASAPWSDDAGIEQRARGFWLSAPGTYAMALSSGGHGGALELDVEMAVPAGGSVGVLWNSAAPLGTVGWPLPTGGAPASRCNASALMLTASGWQLQMLPPAPPGGVDCVPRVLASGSACPLLPAASASAAAAASSSSVHVHISQTGSGMVNVTCNGEVLAASVSVSRGLGGRAALLALPNSAVNVSSFLLGGAQGWLPVPPPLFYMAIDGLNGWGTAKSGWRSDATAGLWRGAEGGYVCDASSACERSAKFNFVGSGVVLWAPRGLPGSSNVSVCVDGGVVVVVAVEGEGVTPSAPLWASPPLEPGRHAIVITAPLGTTMPLDGVEVLVSPVQPAAT
jgi:hypothetical protein